MAENFQYSKLSQVHESNPSFVQNGKSTFVQIPLLSGGCRRRMAYVVPFLLGVIIVGFLFEFSTIHSSHHHKRRSGRRTIFNNERGRFRKRPYIDEFKEILHLVEDATTTPDESLIPKLNEERWKEPKLFDLNFTWIKNNENMCEKDSEEDIQIMPILVHTARSHFEERLVMRETWGSIPIYKKWDIRFVFLMGEANTSALTPPQLAEQEKRLHKEWEDYGDIVIGSFIDSYENLTYKHLMGYKWILNFCKEANLVMKVDDDVFIDIMRWLDWRTSDLQQLAKNPSKVIPDLYCKIWPDPKPFRKKSSKWYVSYDVWPDEYYPDFCSGWAYTLTVDLIQKLYVVSYDVKFNWIDDLYVTGQLIETLKEKYEFIPEIKNISPSVTLYTNTYKSECEKGDLNVKRKFKVVAKVDRGENFKRDMMCMWNKVLYDRSMLN